MMSSDWQPIETAPRDGTEIDLWTRDEDGFPGRIPDGAWRTRDGLTGWYARSERGWMRIEEFAYEPTHWMPLPAPPEVSHDA